MIQFIVGVVVGAVLTLFFLALYVVVQDEKGRDKWDE